MYDLLIIGGGPAGLSAAIYGVRAGLKTAVVVESPICGGQILNTYEVDNYLGFPGVSGGELAEEFKAHADKLGVEFIIKAVTKIEDCGEVKKVHTDSEVLETKTVIVATGAHHAHLGAPGEEELAGMGVSYCATCDGAFFRKRTVAVVGGGDVALEDAIYLAGICEKVYLIHRRDSFRGAASLQKKLESYPNVEFVLNTTVSKISGEDMVEALELKNTVTGEESSINVNGVFIAVGIHPSTELVKDLVECDNAGYVLAGEDCATSVPGIYVAGDARKKPMRQIITAVADGANAAVAAAAYLS